MKKTLFTFAVLILTSAAALPALQRSGEPSTQTPPAKPDQPADKKPVPSLTGRWAMELNMSMGQSTPVLNLKQDGEKITGTYTSRYGTFPLEGTLKVRAVQLVVTISVEGTQVDMAFSGEVAADGQSMKGEADLGQAGDGTWVARREKAQ
jgi:hypothetical protein